MLICYLQAHGMEPTEAGHTIYARRVSGRECFDRALLNFILPGRDGFVL